MNALSQWDTRLVPSDWFGTETSDKTPPIPAISTNLCLQWVQETKPEISKQYNTSTKTVLCNVSYHFVVTLRGKLHQRNVALCDPLLNKWDLLSLRLSNHCKKWHLVILTKLVAGNVRLRGISYLTKFLCKPVLRKNREKSFKTRIYAESHDSTCEVKFTKV